MRWLLAWLSLLSAVLLALWSLSPASTLPLAPTLLPAMVQFSRVGAGGKLMSRPPPEMVANWPVACRSGPLTVTYSP